MATSIKTKKIFVLYDENQSSVKLYSTLKTLVEDYPALKINTLYKFDFENKLYFKDHLKINLQRIY